MATTERILAVLRKKFQFSEGQVPHGATDMLHEVGNAPGALLYALLFVPELSIVADCVLLTNGSSDIEKRFLKAKGEGRMPLDRLEASFNRIELPSYSSIERSRMARSAWSRRRLPSHGGVC
jgi:hypothetical protein